jgi:hypothetical protein
LQAAITTIITTIITTTITTTITIITITETRPRAKQLNYI